MPKKIIYYFIARLAWAILFPLGLFFALLGEGHTAALAIALCALLLNSEVNDLIAWVDKTEKEFEEKGLV